MRDYNDKDFKDFRRKVRNRDKCCQWPKCKAKRKLQVHHIYPWSSYPTLRTMVSNGITLCKKHHIKVTGQEMEYAEFFKTILRIKNG